MNPSIRIFSIALLVIGLSPIASAAGPVRIFYDVGPTSFEVSQFKDELPVLDAPLESDVERVRFDGDWSYSGQLPVDPEFMSMVYPYWVRKNPEIYSNRGEPASYYVHLHSGFSKSLSWKLEGRGSHLIVFGWLVGDALQGIMVTESKASRSFQAYLSMEGAGISPDGILVAWLVDPAGRLVPLDNRKEDSGRALRIAAMNGDLETLSKQIEGDSGELNRKDETGRTLLMYAAFGGRTELAAYLIEQGAKAFEKDKARLNALEIAAEGGCLEIVEAIAKKRASGGDQKMQYTIAAVKAYRERHQEVTIHLLQIGAKVNLNKKSAPEKVGGLYASECVKLARWVQSEYDVEGSYSKDGFNYMHAAATYADTKLLESLKTEGALLTEATGKGITPLLIASGLGNREAICWLMENGGRAEETNGMDPVLYAVRKGVEDSVSCLIDYGVNVNREEHEGVTPLMFACSLGGKEIAETLMDAGGLWLFESKYCDSILAQLIRLDSPKLMEGLFEQGLANNYKLYGALRLVDVAAFYNAGNVAELLNGKSPGIQSKLIKAKDLAARPEILQRTNIDYPFELQEKHGDVDVLVTVGIADTGIVGMVDVDSGVPKEIRDLVERSLANWRFKPLETGNEESLAVVAFKLPLRISMREEDIFEIGELDELPIALFQAMPYYPFYLKSERIAGYVILEWIIDAGGVVRRPKAVKSSHRAFEEPAIESIKRSKWPLPKKNGVPVAVRVQQRIDFNP